MDAILTGYVWNHDGHLGSVYIERTAPSGNIVFDHFHVIRLDNGSLGYYTQTGERGFEQSHKTTDRQVQTAIMEDDTAERQDALRSALLGDGWQAVETR